jgi:hypothetical protein
MFLSSVVLAGGSAAALAKSFQQDDVGHRSVAPGDALFEHVQLQLAALLRNARARGGFLVAEDAASAAAFMRVVAIHARGLQLDHEAHQTLAARLAAIGRDGVINLPPDLTTLRARIRRKGFELSDRLVADASTTDVPTRDAALEAMEDGHTTDICERLAEAFEVIAPRLAARPRGTRRIASPPREESWCTTLFDRWPTFLAVACYLTSFNDAALQEFVDSMWAGFAIYDDLHQQNC